MDFDNPKVYGDTSITDGLVFFGGPTNSHKNSSLLIFFFLKYRERSLRAQSTDLVGRCSTAAYNTKAMFIQDI